MMPRTYETENRAQHPGDDEPDDKQVKSLKRVKTHPRVLAEPHGCKHHDSGNPADHGDVAEYRRRTVANASERIDWGRRRARLPRSAIGAVHVGVPDPSPALATIG